MKKICAYTRVSTDKSDQLNSLDNQIAYFQMVAKDRDDVELVKIYSDEGLTGTNPNRPQFLQMLRDAGLIVSPRLSSRTRKPLKNKFEYEVDPHSNPLFEEIWIKNTSRFARNTLSQEIIDVLATKEVYIYFIEQNINTRDELNRGLLLKLFQVFDEQDSKDKSLKVRQGRKAAAMRGKIISNGKLFGYHYEDHEFTIIEEEAKIVREIFSLYGQGLGVRRILQQLNEKGYKTRANRNFGKSTINRILQNEKYTGKYTAGIWDSGVVFNKKTPVLKPEDKWHIHEGAMPAIIDKKLFDKCQEIRKKRTNFGNQKGVYHGTSIFAGKLFCAHCGKKYYSNRDRGRQYYNCSTKKFKGTSYCASDNIDNDFLEELCLKEIEKHILSLKSKEILIRYGLLAIKYQLQQTETLNVDAQKLLKQKNRVAEEEKKLLDLYMDNLISKNVYEEKYKAIKEKMRDIYIKENAKENVASFVEKQCQEIDDFLDRIEVDDLNNSNLEQLVNLYVEKITIAGKEEIVVDFKGQDLLADIKQTDVFDTATMQDLELVNEMILKAHDLGDGKIGFEQDGKIVIFHEQKIEQFVSEERGLSLKNMLDSFDLGIVS